MNDFEITYEEMLSEQNNEIVESGFEYFTLKLLLSTKNKSQFIFSKLVYQSLLYMAFASKDNTRKEIMDCLVPGKIEMKYESDFIKLLICKFKTDNDETFKIVEEFILDNKYEFSSHFLEITKNVKIVNSDFNNKEEIVKQVNDFVLKETGIDMKIVSVEDLNNVILLLCSTAIFNGKWFKPFDKKLTEYSDFTLESGEKEKVKFMVAINDRFDYGEDKNKQWISIEYDNGYSMFIVLPKDDKTISDIYKDLKENINFQSKNTKIRELKIPLWNCSSDLQLKKILNDVGINDCFSDKADLSNLLSNKENVKVGNIFHKTNIKVDEEGTIATGSNVSLYQLKCITFDPNFIADKPFIYFLTDKTGMFFAIGSVLGDNLIKE